MPEIKEEEAIHTIIHLCSLFREKLFSYPFIYKELSQNKNSNIFYGLSFLFLLSLEAISLFILLITGEDLTAAGSAIYFTVMVLILLILILSLGHKALRDKREIDRSTESLFYLSGIPPRKYLNHRIFSHLVEVLFFSAILLPFVLLSYIIGGVGLFKILELFIIIALISFPLTIASIIFPNLESSLVRIMLIFLIIAEIISAISASRSFFTMLHQFKPEFLMAFLATAFTYVIMTLILYEAANTMIRHTFCVPTMYRGHMRARSRKRRAKKNTKR